MAEREWTQDEIDDDLDRFADDDDCSEVGFTEEDCGRWYNGRLGPCRLAGTEECDWECPIRHRQRAGKSTALPLFDAAPTKPGGET